MTESSGLRRIVAISASLVTTYAATSVLGLVFWTLATRQYTVAAVGVAGAAVSAMGLLSALGAVGLGTMLIARLPRHPQGTRRLLVRTSLAVAGGVTGVLALVVPLVGIHLLHLSGLRSFAGSPGHEALFVVGTALASVALVLDQAVLVLGSGSLQLERNIIASATKVAVLVALAALGWRDGMAIFTAWAVGTLVSLPHVARRTRGGRDLQDSRRVLHLAEVRGLGRSALSHHALNTTLQAPLQLLPLVVTVVLTTADNGVFSAAMQLTGFVFALPYAVSVGLFAAADGDEGGVLKRMRFTLPFGLVVSAAADAVLFPLAPWVLRAFGGVYAEQGAGVLRVLVLAGLPFVVKDHYVALRRVQGRTTSATRVMLGFTVLEVVAATVGARLAGLVGLGLVWVAVLVVEAVVLAAPLVQAQRSLVADGAAAPEAVDDGAPGAVAAPAPALTPAPAPERVAPRRPATPRATSSRSLVRHRAPSRWPAPSAGPLLAVSATGLLVMALAAGHARRGDTAGSLQVWWMVGLATTFLPGLVGVLHPRTARPDRLLLALATPLALQVSRVVLYPTAFAFHDEFIHANVLRQIDDTHHLFTPNPLLPVTAYYPGMEVVTQAVQSVTGLGAHTSAVLVLLLTRLVLAAALMALVEAVTRSSRAAAIAVVLYLCSPQLLFFNSQFSYQTMALPLAVLCVQQVVVRRRGGRASLVLPLLTQLALDFTHHVTAGLLLVAVAVWCGIEAAVGRRHGRREWPALALLGVAGAVGMAATILNPGNSLVGYLQSIADSSWEALRALVDSGHAKPLFQNTAGVVSTPAEQVLLVGSVLVSAAVLVPSTWRSLVWVRRGSSVAVLLVLTTLLWPLGPLGHLTAATAEVGDRSNGFAYLGAAFVVACWLVRQRARTSWLVATSAAVTLCFLGGVELGAGPVSQQLPGSFEVSADARSVDPYNVAAAQWEAAHLPHGSRVYADRVGGLLAAAVGDQDPVLHVSTGVDASRLLLDPASTPVDARLIRAARIQYLVVDRRDALGLPNQGVYIESGEYGDQGRTSPPPVAALVKFDAVAGARRIYDNGFVSIYDVRGVLGAH